LHVVDVDKNLSPSPSPQKGLVSNGILRNEVTKNLCSDEDNADSSLRSE